MLEILPVRRQSPARGLRADDRRFAAMEAGHPGETLARWEADRLAVIVGRFGSVADDVHVEACRRDGVPVLRRASGGGTVLVGRGCLLYSLTLDLEARPSLLPVADSYRIVLEAMLGALAVPSASRCGASDLAVGGCKVSGSAQRRGRRTLLHHGTLLYDFPLPLLGRYLREPTRQPSYRAGRTHDAFVANLRLGWEDVANRVAGIGTHLPR